jgi:hypothetical protein
MKLYLYSPNTPSWRGAQLRKSTDTTLPFTFNIYGGKGKGKIKVSDAIKAYWRSGGIAPRIL